MTPSFWRGRRVLITGHTGFKGSWLTLWLCHWGAKVYGYSLPPPTTPSLYHIVDVGRIIDEEIADLRDADRLVNCVARIKPDIVFHMGAQPLVSESYRDPIGTFASNLMGTVHLLDAVRRIGGVGATVIVTSDKCYDERDVTRPHKETDPMGGRDPYSASKGCCELACAAYSQAFFAHDPATGALCSARAGNAIGGGDWAGGRLLPDLITGFSRRIPVPIRRPKATRPWQHVLEPLGGYLRLAEAAACGTIPRLSGGWNFGPQSDDHWPVGEVCRRAAALWGDGASLSLTTPPFPEAPELFLDSGRAENELGWHPRWRLADALARTIEWYRRHQAGEDMRMLSIAQINDYIL